MMTTTETVTVEQITKLRREAEDSGDDGMLHLCERAIWTHDKTLRPLSTPTLSDDTEAIAKCVRAIRDAEGRAEGVGTSDPGARYGWLCDCDTTERLRPATPTERSESRHAGFEGYILVDGRRCYVEE